MLSEPWTFRFPYRRTAGPVVSRFFAGLAERRILGLRMAGGGVLVPPHGHDPRTGQTLDEWVEVSSQGTVTTWTWIDEPLPQHPLDHPFAYALVLLDGAATPMLHVVDAAAVHTGMRVQARWAPEPRGHICDIACFEPLDAAAQDAAAQDAAALPGIPDVPAGHRFDASFASDYLIGAGKALSVHLRGLAAGKLVGLRGPSGNVYLHPTGADPISGAPIGSDAVELSDTGTVVRFCVVNIPVRGQSIKVPFAAADVLIDGADSPIMVLVTGIPHDQVRLGLRVRAVWLPEDERRLGVECIASFEPSGEPDADLDSLKEYL